LNIEKIKGCVVAIAENDTDFKNSAFVNHDKLLATAMGGKERLHSVISALNTLRPFEPMPLAGTIRKCWSVDISQNYT
jgi:2-C-methyl-D-erythritol 4-phosphate cytidylyltransferase